MFGAVVPNLPPTEYLQEVWQELGFARPLPMGGVAGFEWQEVQSYITATKSEISPVEARTLVDMSRAYASGLNDTHPLSIEPMERNL